MSTDTQDSSTKPVFDLTTRYMAETIEVPINDPATGAPTGMVWLIGSQFGKDARGALNKVAALRLGAKGEVEVAPSEVDSLLEQIIASTKGWNGFVVGGAPVECTEANVRAVLTDERTAWIRPQVQLAFLSLSRFFDSAKAS